jgi:Protein of unknown function (DUF3987)
VNTAEYIASIKEMQVALHAPVSKPAAFNDPMPDFPASLKAMPRWVRWQIAKVNNRFTKVPYRMDGSMAASTRAEDWTDYRTAVTGAVMNEKGGIGFVVDGSIVGVDIDGCRNSETGAITEWGQAIIDLLDSYTEVTPSKTGVRVWVRGFLPEKKNRFQINPDAGFGGKVGVECYSDARYFTVTGECIQLIPSGVEDRNLTALYSLLHETSAKYPVAKKETKVDANGEVVSSSVQAVRLPTASPTAMQPCKLDFFLRGEIVSTEPIKFHLNGFELTYGSGSEADMAMATLLAMRHLQNSDDVGVDEVMNYVRTSKLYDDKWEREDYQNTTINKGILKALQMKAESASQTPAPVPAIAATPQPAVPESDVDASLDEDYPVHPFGEYSGPAWDDEWMYGIAGDITRKASKFCEAHPAGMYLDLLVSLGSIIGRGPFFTVGSSRHYTNEFMIRVGTTSTARKGTGRDAIDEPLKLVDSNWYQRRVMSGFGSGEAIVGQIADPMGQMIPDKKTQGGFKQVTRPGVDDKRLCIREGEMASVFQLAGKKESRADIILRDGWDGKPLHNLVKGKSEGISNSAGCMEPHFSISGDTTRSELKRRMPEGADQNGFGNRFLYAYVQRVKLCPMGGPPIDWSKEVVALHDIITFARGRRYVAMTKAATKVWHRMYVEMENELSELPPLTQSMCARGVAHVRRLALILALLDKSEVIETKHLHAGKQLWDYCQESAQFIFEGTTKEQERVAGWVAQQHRSVTVREVTDEVFHRHRKVEWVKSQLDGLVIAGRLVRTGEGDESQYVSKQ